jgi:hypothetical protein
MAGRTLAGENEEPEPDRESAGGDRADVQQLQAAEKMSLFFPWFALYQLTTGERSHVLDSAGHGAALNFAQEWNK